MSEVTYLHPDGTSTVQTTGPGESVMEAAVRNGVPGIVGECGGALSCSTCHVYVDEACWQEFGEVGEMEDDMLDGVATDRLPHSRLSCQIRPTAQQRLRVTTPESQY
ncbi:2Fe-2S iron-sulfur cluster binding domain-containing protein [Gordonia sp. HNM0687]|uniref:2Fe-2S iron-sulfur cluster binding domain-containing protein n=1 Tax=Gordonia mangrovi TaxID=2665643 RepID=A0A6L7GKF0_9ACTN|nr:2Fe-2S iron-sulfur cluster-binding protein [Gordonia mangrovi]MXP19992.1 2Fe-2S iron-sulfur cluster binding domain-containing protein [Gordonia mangrovi]UVF79392.1 (2Fe-2S)-binding protein [Gordonia mangrovi]